MTDTRLPDHWLLNPTLDKFSHEAWRLFTRALMYCNQQGTDGEIETLYMKYVWPYGDPSEHVLELLETGWLMGTERGFVIPDWEGKGQSPASQVLAYKENARLRQQKSREKRKSSDSEAVTSDVARDVGQARSGQDRSGQAIYQEAPWPEVRQPGTLPPQGPKEISHAF